MLPLLMSTCMCLGGNVASVHVHVYVWEGGSMLPLFKSM